MSNESQAYKKWVDHCSNIQNSTIVAITETPTEKHDRIERAKKDYAFFVEYYFPHYATAKVPLFHIAMARLVKAFPVLMLLVIWGRGLAKSVVGDILLPMWLWINGETIYMVIIGNNEDKAEILLNDIQAEFANNARIKHDFGDQVVAGRWAKGGFSCKERFTAKAIGMG